MINKNEIRIGSWYQNRSSDKALKFKTVEDFEDAIYVSIYCKPIPLTEEWLEKFGFEWKSENKTWRIEYRIPFVDDGKRIAIHVWEDEVMGIWGVTLWEVVPIDDVTPTVIKYVHQLQNLYFALTGQELTIKQ